MGMFIFLIKIPLICVFLAKEIVASEQQTKFLSRHYYPILANLLYQLAYLLVDLGWIMLSKTNWVAI